MRPIKNIRPTTSAAAIYRMKSSSPLLIVTSNSGMIRSVPKRSDAPSSGSWPRYESEITRIVPALRSRLQALHTTMNSRKIPMLIPIFCSNRLSSCNGLLLNRRLR